MKEVIDTNFNLTRHWVQLNEMVDGMNMVYDIENTNDNYNIILYIDDTRRVLFQDIKTMAELADTIKLLKKATVLLCHYFNRKNGVAKKLIKINGNTHNGLSCLVWNDTAEKLYFCTEDGKSELVEDIAEYTGLYGHFALDAGRVEIAKWKVRMHEELGIVF